MPLLSRGWGGRKKKGFLVSWQLLRCNLRANKMSAWVVLRRELLALPGEPMLRLWHTSLSLTSL